MTKTTAVQALEGNYLAAIGTGGDTHVFEPPLLITEHYRPFNNTNLVGLTLQGGKCVRALLHTPVELAPAKY